MLLVPTRRRLSKLKNFCQSAVAAETTCPAMILIDAKDFKDNQKSYTDLEMFEFPNKDWKIYVTEAERMGPKVREVHGVWREHSWVGILNDDHHIVTKEWDKRLIAQLDGKNFITCNDRWNAPKRAAGATLFSMALMEAFGFPMFPLQIDHLGIDDVFENIGRATGCWEVDMSVIVEHHHAFKNPDMIDETHKLVYGTRPWAESTQAKETEIAFRKWAETDFAGIVERVKALRGSDVLAELPKKDNRGTVSISN